jgi:hypothetical protein
LSHHGLIKILVSFALEAKHLTWKGCLQGNFKPGKSKKSGSKMKVSKATILSNRQTQLQSSSELHESPASVNSERCRTNKKHDISEPETPFESKKRPRVLFFPDTYKSPVPDNENTKEKEDKCMDKPNPGKENMEYIESEAVTDKSPRPFHF